MGVHLCRDGGNIGSNPILIRILRLMFIKIKVQDLRWYLVKRMGVWH